MLRDRRHWFWRRKSHEKLRCVEQLLSELAKTFERCRGICFWDSRFRRLLTSPLRRHFDQHYHRPVDFSLACPARQNSQLEGLPRGIGELSFYRV